MKINLYGWEAMTAHEQVCWILMRNVMKGLDIRSCIALHCELLGDQS